MPEQREVHQRVETVIVGGGQAGLAVSYGLTRQNREHVVLERERLGQRWREKWDSFTLVTPNWTVRLPGAAYDGPDPDAFMPRDQVVRYLEGYARSFAAPVRQGVTVTAVEPTDGPGRYRVSSDGGTYLADYVVTATGNFQKPRIPELSRTLPPAVKQLHSSQYRSPRELPDGGVLVVGTGQSGAQIAEELHQAGRPVYLSVGRCGRMPRRYRGRDIARWGEAMGLLERTVDQLPSPAARFACHPHVTGKDGGHTINLRRLGEDGVVLLGRTEGAADGRIHFAEDLLPNLRRADEFARDILREVNKHIERTGTEAPPGPPPEEELWTGPEPPVIRGLDLRAEGVGSIVWATGFGHDYSLVRSAPLDEFGYPVQKRGVSPRPGLFFVGLHWLHTAKSGLLLGVGEDAAHVVEHLTAEEPGSG